MGLVTTFFRKSATLWHNFVLSTDSPELLQNCRYWPLGVRFGGIRRAWCAAFYPQARAGFLIAVKRL
jgi:hypothetical protein